jgi:hypothetical protein
MGSPRPRTRWMGLEAVFLSCLRPRIHSGRVALVDLLARGSRHGGRRRRWCAYRTYGRADMPGRQNGSDSTEHSKWSLKPSMKTVSS